jgi:predicted nucleotidyltransferase
VTAGLPGWTDDAADAVGYPLVFVTVSGAHLYGFASVDSDVDLRGVHVLPAEEVVGLRPGPETIQRGGVREGVELDLVSHDLAKFARLLARPNGYVLEQLCSPLVVRTGELHERLRSCVPGLVTRGHERHYRGFADGQWQLFNRTAELKPALYTLRVLLSGIYLMRTGEVVADLRELWPGHDLPYVPELIAAKTSGEHRSFVDGPVSRDRLERDVIRLQAALADAAERSSLPDEPTAIDDLHDLLVRVRLGRL